MTLQSNVGDSMTYHLRRAHGHNGHDQDQIARGIKARLNQPIVLLGLMGSGKSRLGRMLARAMDVSFYDCDAELELSAGRSAREIFDQIGPEAYEQAENRILKRLISQDGISVIATGGGAAIAPDVIDQIFSDTVAIWIRADLELMLDRTSRGLPRPHLTGRDPRPVLQAMIDEYHPVYARAHVTVDTHDGPAADVLNQTLYALNAYLDKVPNKP